MTKDFRYFQGWIEMAEHTPVSFGEKRRVKRKDGKRGFSVPVFDMGHQPQMFWRDLNGAEHPLEYYPYYAFLRKDGGKI